MAAIQSKPHSSSPSSSPPPVRVVIVGAGFAGLACARALARGWPRRTASDDATTSPPSLEIVLLEASTDGVGGRARSATLPRTGPVELGCTWLHGAVQGNAAFEFYTEEQAKDNSLPALQPEKDKEQQRWRMELLRPGQRRPLAGPNRAAAVAAMAAFGDAIDAAAEDEELLKDADATVGDALRRRFDELLADADASVSASASSPSDEEKQRRRLLLTESWACRERLHRAYDGFRSSDDAGAAFAADYQELEGEHLPVPGGGYAALARRLLRAAQREAEGAGGGGGEKGEDDGSAAHVALRVRLGCPVERIEWGDEGGGETTAATAGRRRARVVLEKDEADKDDGGEDAAIIDADAVVVTVSLGVLQARAMATAADEEDDAAAATTPTTTPPLQPPPRPLFSPPLPERKQRALRLMRIGVIDKLFFEWGQDGIEEEGEESGSSDGGASDDQGDDGDDDAQNDTQPQPFPMVCHEDEDDEEKKDQQAAATPADDTVGPRKTHTATAAPLSAAAAAATSWCFLWPSNDGDPSHEWGAAGRPEPSSRPPFSVGAALERALASAAAAAGENDDDDDDDERQRVRRDAAQALARRWMDADAAVFGQQEDDSSVPRWLRGLHSLRFSDGPEWIRGGAVGGEGEDAPLSSSSSSSIAQARVEGSACVVWATSAAALHSETLTDEELRKQAWPALLKAFPALSRAAAGKDKKKRLLLRRPPSAVARSRWGTDPRFHGSYSYPGPGATGAEAEALAEPLVVAAKSGGLSSSSSSSSAPASVPVVLFAGEHTSRRFMGTVHGAMESGEREAERLLGVLVGKV